MVIFTFFFQGGGDRVALAALDFCAQLQAALDVPKAGNRGDLGLWASFRRVNRSTPERRGLPSERLPMMLSCHFDDDALWQNRPMRHSPSEARPPCYISR
jgi:hypothetical protein